MSGYRVGVDIGGTFTDCVAIDDDGRVTVAKSPSTPPSFGDGMINAMTVAAEQLGLDFEVFCSRIRVLTHGTTVGTNTLIQRRGAKVGLLTTRGHEDAIHIMRGSRGITSRNLNQVVHFPESRKPDPIVAKRHIRGVSERVDCFGQVVVPLNEEDAARAIDALLEDGVEAIAICLLWSFKYGDHERRLAEMVRQRAPECFVTCSVDLAPKWGEYERMTATALNAYVGPVTSRYLRALDTRLKAAGYRAPLQITQCGGGSISVERAVDAPLLTLDSGPVSGVTGSSFLGDRIGTSNIITTDMGGTSFDVGIIHDGRPAFSFISNVGQYEYFIPKVDIQAIGSGGGSMAIVDAASGTLRVGPESAGADPGPACYGNGNPLPTVTDADVVLGYIDPDNFLGGRIRLDRAAAEAAVRGVADQLGLTLEQTAAGIAKIAEFKMADIIRKTTVEKGFDPRDFTLFAFGGAGPVHAGIFARELGVARVLVPLNRIASTWCAFGAATAEILHIHEHTEIQGSPFEAEAVSAVLTRLAAEAHAVLDNDGIARRGRVLRFSVDMRHRGQINEVEVDLEGLTARDGRFGARNVRRLLERFYARYEAIYGRGSSYRDARLEMVTFRVRASAAPPRVELPRAARLRREPPARARSGQRRVYWTDLGRTRPTPVYDGALLQPGNRLAGPAIVETSQTTIVVHPSQHLGVDALGNFELQFGD